MAHSIGSSIPLNSSETADVSYVVAMDHQSLKGPNTTRCALLVLHYYCSKVMQKVYNQCRIWTDTKAVNKRPTEILISFYFITVAAAT